MLKNIPQLETEKCGARASSLESCEVRCQFKKGHQFECFSKYRAEYEHGVVSWGEMTWCGPNNLPKKEAEDVQQLQR